MSSAGADDLTTIAALAEPVRRELYEFVVAQPVPVDRDAAAKGVGIGRPLAAFHLDRLARAGLLAVEYRRRSGRTGPGAGRPAKYYKRPADLEVSVSLPARHYDLAAEILAEGVERRPDAVPEILSAARARGAALADAASGKGHEGVLDLLRAQGYEPDVASEGVVRLRNCPFHSLVEDHRELTCSMNLAMLEGATDGLGDADIAPVPQPRDGFCCVAFVPRNP